MSCAVIREVDPTEKGWKFIGRNNRYGLGVWEKPDGTWYVFPPGAREVLTEFKEIPAGQILRLVRD